MGKSPIKQTKQTPLKKYERYLVTNFIVRAKTPVALDLQKATEAFAQAQRRFPGMLRSTLPSDKRPEEEEYQLAEKDPAAPAPALRTLVLAEKELAIAACHPLSSTQQLYTIRELVKLLHRLNLLTPIAIDYVDFKHVFEFDYLGNHHGRILDVLFKGTCLERLSRDIGGEPTNFSPGLLIRHPTDYSLRFAFELLPQTALREIESGKYDGDQIAAVCSVIKTRELCAGEHLPKVLTILQKESVKVLTRVYLSAVVEPLRRELGE